MGVINKARTVAYPVGWGLGRGKFRRTDWLVRGNINERSPFEISTSNLGYESTFSMVRSSSVGTGERVHISVKTVFEPSINRLKEVRKIQKISVCPWSVASQIMSCHVRLSTSLFSHHLAIAMAWSE